MKRGPITIDGALSRMVVDENGNHRGQAIVAAVFPPCRCRPGYRWALPISHGRARSEPRLPMMR